MDDTLARGDALILFESRLIVLRLAPECDPAQVARRAREAVARQGLDFDIVVLHPVFLPDANFLPISPGG